MATGLNLDLEIMTYGDEICDKITEGIYEKYKGIFDYEEPYYTPEQIREEIIIEISSSIQFFYYTNLRIKVMKAHKDKKISDVKLAILIGRLNNRFRNKCYSAEVNYLLCLEKIKRFPRNKGEKYYMEYEFLKYRYTKETEEVISRIRELKELMKEERNKP